MTPDRGDGALWVDRYAPTALPHLSLPMKGPIGMY